MIVRFLPEARDEFFAAISYYESRREGLGTAFSVEVEHALARLLAYPEIGTLTGRSGARRALLERFPFSIFYRLREEEVLIIALAHQRRRPGYWRNR